MEKNKCLNIEHNYSCLAKKHGHKFVEEADRYGNLVNSKGHKFEHKGSLAYPERIKFV